MPHTRSPSLLWLVIVAAVLFQSHWLDDVGTADRDVAGLSVGLAGAVLLLAGLVGRTTAAGRLILDVSLAFVILVSLADLIGLRVDGSLAPGLLEHWRTSLGWPLTVVVALTLLLAAAAFVLLMKRRR